MKKVKQLKIKFTFMWGNKMSRKAFYLILITFSIQINLDAQKMENELEHSFLWLNSPYASHTIQKEGGAIKIGLPGLLNVGEISGNYKDSNLNSYTLAIGIPYALIGYNKSFSRSENSTYYANLSFGISDNNYFMGSGGISYLQQTDYNFVYEIAISGFFNEGFRTTGLYGFQSILDYNTRGLCANIILSKSFLKNIIFSFTGGISYSYIQYANFGDEFYSKNRYVSKEQAKNSDYIGELKWKRNTLYQFLVAISYHF